MTPELLPTFENCPFSKIDGVVTVTNDTLRMLRNAGVVETCYNATMVQKVSYTQLSEEDMHPYNRTAPHNGVVLQNNGMYRSNPEGGLLTTEIKTGDNPTDDQTIHYFKSNGCVYAICSVDDAEFGTCNTLMRVGMKRVARIDTVLMCGTTLQYTSKDGGEAHYSGVEPAPIPVTTYWKDESGLTRKLSISDSLPWIRSIIEWGTKLNNESSDIPANLWPPVKPLAEDINGKKWDHYNPKISTHMVMFYVGEDRNLKMFTYAMQNNYVDRNVVLTNVIALYHSRDYEKAPTFKEIDWEWESESFTKCQNEIATHWFKIVPSTSDNDQTRKNEDKAERKAKLKTFSFEMAFAAYTHVTGKKATTPYTEVVDQLNQSIEGKIILELANTCSAVLSVKNEDLATYIPKGFHPGFGIGYLKPQFYETDSIIVSRPGGFQHIVSKPSLVRQHDMASHQEDVSFTWRQQSANCNNGVSNTSFKLTCGAITQKLVNDTEEVINPMDLPATREKLNNYRHYATDEFLMKAANTECLEGSWPFIIPVYMPAEAMEVGMSPVGRIVTPWTYSVGFEKGFYDQNLNDAMFSHGFTVNKVNNELRVNANNVFYRPEVLSNPDCPMNKYWCYNHKSTEAIHKLKHHHKRLHPSEMPATSSSATPSRCMSDTADLSNVMGIALSTRSWTSPELLKHEDQIKNPFHYQARTVITSGNNYFVPGSEGFGKCNLGVSYQRIRGPFS